MIQVAISSVVPDHMIFLLNIPSIESERCKRLLSTNYSFIKRACETVVQWQGGGRDDAASDEAEYLLGRALEHFMEDDYRRLRGGEIKNATSFFRGCIENLFRDILAERHGKDRGKERARELGEVGLQIYGLLKRGYNTDAIHGLLSRETGEPPWEEVFRIVQRIKGSNALPPTDATRVVQTPGDDGDDPDPSAFEVVDQRDPGLLLVAKRKYELRRQVLADLEQMLDSEGKVMVRLYFLEQGEGKRTVADIAAYLGKTPKATDHKLRRILTGFREYLTGKGIAAEDIL